MGEIAGQFASGISIFLGGNPMNTNNKTATTLVLFHAIICAANLRKEVEDRDLAEKRAYANTDEAITSRQRFAAQASTDEEELAEALLLEVTQAELEAYAKEVVEAKGQALDVVFTKLDKAYGGYHRLGLTPPACVVDSHEASYKLAEDAYNRAVENQEAVKAFLANR
jgi:hypothetical protein